MRRNACILLLSGLLVTAMSYAQSSSGGKTIPAGVWGAHNASMEVTATGATVTFECGSGEILEALKIDAQGRFRAKGTYQSDGPGPSYIADADHPNATYSGEIKGNTMRLQVEIPSGAQTYTLERGKKTKTLGCK